MGKYTVKTIKYTNPYIGLCTSDMAYQIFKRC